MSAATLLSDLSEPPLGRLLILSGSHDISHPSVFHKSKMSQNFGLANRIAPVVIPAAIVSLASDLNYS